MWSQVLSPKARRLRLGLLAFTLTSFSSFMYGSQNQILGLGNCPLKYLTGVPCPFCGMTRSVRMLLHGDYTESMSFHLFGMVFFIAVSSAILCLLVEIVTGYAIISPLFKRLLSYNRLQVTGLSIFLSYYILRLYALYGGGDWHNALMQSSLGVFLLSGVYTL